MAHGHDQQRTWQASVDEIVGCSDVGTFGYPTLPNWAWPGQEGKFLTVEVYSGAERVRLYLKDKLIG